ncbi:MULTISPECIES: hypothetical protein [Bacillaceae]|uniref:hypothetical protein n=1 Tax=Bacillaceae TaxID=186817 RepID=UPI000621DF32|nr:MULTISPECIES: hypothetical protein [Bacillaceae]KKE79658.1 hypothetical protein WH51_06130 [Bacilli bacterium VT-13-104]PZD89628.1 hypothetical protein DEJ64_00890 [Bacilli bacterium]MED4474697.1 hypothetical protein [Oceanobacillus caeni]PZD91150.1 hypothetical protein DEJ60_00890 [Bacilli bacterium]PZD92697.1 hypothetical protein DEJ66_00890 [Bacilli bacterium]
MLENKIRGKPRILFHFFVILQLEYDAENTFIYPTSRFWGNKEVGGRSTVRNGPISATNH